MLVIFPVTDYESAVLRIDPIQQREPAFRLRPRKLHDTRPVLGTVRPRCLRVLDRLELARVQMTPLPLRLQSRQPTTKPEESYKLTLEFGFMV